MDQNGSGKDFYWNLILLKTLEVLELYYFIYIITFFCDKSIYIREMSKLLHMKWKLTLIGFR